MTSATSTIRGIEDLFDTVVRLGGGEVEVDGQTVQFFIGEVPCMAYVKEGGNRIRGTAYLDTTPSEEVGAWVARQPQPESGLLELVADPGGERPPILRILFERAVGWPDMDSDPLYDEILIYADAWRNRLDIEQVGDVSGPFVLPGDPRDSEPSNAWLLLGDGASYPTSQEVEADAQRGRAGIFEWLWTAAKQTEVGDLVFCYFISPHKAAHFVARTASRAFFDREIRVNADKQVADAQWWSYLTPPIEIEPIPVEVLRNCADGFLPLRGRSGVYLRPEVIAALPVVARNPEDAAELARVLRTPTGNPDLPDPADVSLQEWKAIASGALKLEKHVEQYIVEPMLRFALASEPGLTAQRSFRIGAKIADYVVTGPEGPRCVVEVKLAFREAADGVWEHSPDFAQVRGYADSLNTGSILMDANRICLIDRQAQSPWRIIDRRHATPADLTAIATHLRGELRPWESHGACRIRKDDVGHDQPQSCQRLGEAFPQ